MQPKTSFLELTTTYKPFMSTLDNILPMPTFLTFPLDISSKHCLESFCACLKCFSVAFIMFISDLHLDVI